MTTMQDFSFRFKQNKETGVKRAPITLKAPVPAVEDIIAILEKGGNGLQLLNDAIYDVIKAALSDQVQANESISQETVNLAELEWQAIANKPAAERATIAPELWEQFAAYYVETMPKISSYSPAQVGVAAQVFTKKCVPAKGNQEVLGKLKAQLAVFMEAPEAENFASIINLLARRLESYMAEGEAKLDLTAL